jgi:ABC-2 type transport system ATP-binding protein
MNANAATSPTVVQTVELSKTYDGVEALRSLDLTVHANSILGFLGPNGAGKTTTLKLLLGLVRPSGGRATVFGLDITEQSDEIRRRIGYLPQDPRFYEHMTARETLRFVAGFFYRGAARAIEARVDEMLALVGLETKADRPISGFSGGERQRLGIAQAQLNQPDLLILDEPAASLDPLGRRDVLALLERLRADATIIYSTHILDDVERISDTVAILDRGRLVARGPIDELVGGSGAPSYLVKIRGHAERAVAALTAEAWVLEVKLTELTDGAMLTIAVSDEGAAEDRLMRVLLADEAVKVVELRRQAARLEEAFIRLIEGGRDAPD